MGSEQRMACETKETKKRRRTISRAVCLEDFLRLDLHLKEKIFPMMNAYQKSTACTTEQSEAFTIETFNVCLELSQSAAKSGDIQGLVFDLNCFNLFALYRNYKQRIRSTDGPQLLCASAAGQLVRFFIERIIKYTDKFFLLAPCNSLHIPCKLANAMYSLLSEVRVKAVGQGRMLGSGRMQIMRAGRNVVDTYSALKDQGQVCARMSKFMAYVFQPCKLNDIFAPLAQREQEIRNKQATLMHSMNLVPRRRCPNKSSFSEDRGRRFVIPDTLLYLEQEDGTLAYGNPDISSIIGDHSDNSTPEPGACAPLQPPEPNPKHTSVAAFTRNETEQYQKVMAKLGGGKSAPIHPADYDQPGTSSQCVSAYSNKYSIINTPTGTLIPLDAWSSGAVQTNQASGCGVAPQQPHLLTNWLQLEQQGAIPPPPSYPHPQQHPTKRQALEQTHNWPCMPPQEEMQTSYDFEPLDIGDLPACNEKPPLDCILDDLLDIEEEKYRSAHQYTPTATASTSSECDSSMECAQYKGLEGDSKKEEPQPSPLSSEIQQIFAYLSNDMSLVHEAHLNKELGL